MHRLLATLFLLALMLTFPLAARGRGEVESTVGGRLGGTLASFSDRFGKPVSANEAAGTVFTAPGYGRIFVQIDHVQGTTDENGRARSIVASSPRPPDLPTTEPDGADWTIAAATERARELLPSDSELSVFAETETPGQLGATCQSTVLEELFGVLTLGQCRVTLVQPTPETVSFVTLALITGSALPQDSDPATNPCEGALDWIQRAGDRLAESQTLLEAVAAVDETEPDAVMTLRGISDSFELLAKEQRNDTPPPAAAQAGSELVSALTAFSQAVADAADGLESGDAALIQRAVEGIESANTTVAQATDELEATASTCSLQLGTANPVASPATN
jgi:hypothetical protein